MRNIDHLLYQLLGAAQGEADQVAEGLMELQILVQYTYTGHTHRHPVPMELELLSVEAEEQL